MTQVYSHSGVKELSFELLKKIISDEIQYLSAHFFRRDVSFLTSSSKLAKFSHEAMKIIQSPGLSAYREETLKSLIGDMLFFGGWSSILDFQIDEIEEQRKLVSKIEKQLRKLKSVIKEERTKSKKQRSELEAVSKEIVEIKNELAKERVSWKKVVGAFVIIAGLVSGVAAIPEAIKVVDDSVNAIADQVMQRPNPKLLQKISTSKIGASDNPALEQK